jgi:8-oxo-dGTP pyrophosphatase MutT (NUDIX family)
MEPGRVLSDRRGGRAALTRDAVIRRFSEHPVGRRGFGSPGAEAGAEPVPLRGDHSLTPGSKLPDGILRPAAVLVPIVRRPEGDTILLTLRTPHLTAHAGQISFPGGRAEPEDADAIATALREAEEEVGLHARHIEVLGSLPTYTTGTGFIVTPVVALIEPPFTIEPDPFEVAEVFEVPLSFLMAPANHRRHGVDAGGVRREFLSMPWRSGDAASRQYFIWGATAAMLRNFYRFLAA